MLTLIKGELESLYYGHLGDSLRSSRPRSTLPMQGAWVQHLVRELDPCMPQLSVHMLQLRLSAT